MLRFKLSSLLAASALAASFFVAGAAQAAAAGSTICSGGSVAAGTYQNLTVTGFCAIDSGDVNVQHDVTVTGTGGLDGAHAGSRLTVGHNLVVQQGGSAFLGCNADDGCGGTLSDTIGGSVSSIGAMFLVIHNSSIGGNVSVSGGTAVYDCSAFAFTDFDVDSIGGNVRITGLNTCWDGFSNNTVGGSVTHANNVAIIVEDFGPDGNFVGGNTIGGNLNCFGDSPTPHLSDEAPVPAPNTVAGRTLGQCVGEV